MRAVVVGLIGAALAGEALGAELIRNPCHNDLCTWFSIEDRRLVGTSLDGALFKVTLRRWRSVHPGGTYARASPRGGGESEVAHFLCSDGRPTALHWDQSVGWRSVGPVALTAPNERSEPVANEYLAVCHGVHTDRSDGFSSIARRFGYSFYQDKQREGVLKSPEEVLTGPAAPPISGAQASTDDEIKAALGQKTWPGKHPVRVR